MGDGGTIIHSTDHGQTWTVVTSGTTEDLRGVHFVNGSQGMAVGKNGTVLKTTNGTDWIPQDSRTTETLWDVYFTSTTSGWIVGEGGTILHTTTGGI